MNGGAVDKVVGRNLLKIVDAYKKATGLSDSTISTQIYGQQTFLRKFRLGEQSITVSKLQEVIQALSNRWPAGTAWPKTTAISLRRPIKQGFSNGKSSPKVEAAARIS